ncbi:HtaA domain-containing protein [Subtercola endophyticus]|uniref:HtaA domain-containing protein n=1 Tax=Subtercola endophyticus TaxID=2895559 RepID=UPI001E3F4289|nr:HtaA domain-containing protein [Subtercola endophyticus]UFS59157.1 HtaA domain-containing protein [Subtercola endophyticus]
MTSAPSGSALPATVAAPKGGRRLEWAVKPSFVAYVEALPDGLVEVGGGVTRTSDGRFVFGADAGSGEFGFVGSVHFFGHHGVLDVTLADPRIEVVGDEFVVTVDVQGERVRVATVEQLLEDGNDVLSASGVEATDDGASLLGGVYQAGTPLDNLTIYSAAA